MKTVVTRFVLLLVLVVYSAPVLAAKTDVIVLRNGDKVTGEVKGLSRGRLELSTAAMGTVYIDWIEVATVISNTGQSVELANGQRFFGPLRKTEDSDMVAIETGPALIDVDMMDIIGMYPVEASFWERLDIRVSLGFSWDKASDVGKYNVGLNTEYRHPDHLTRVVASSEVTTQTDEENTKRANASINHMRFRPNKRFTAYFGNVERNDELGLRMRSLVGVGYGWVPIRSYRNMFLITVGADVNHETPTEGNAENNVEGVIRVGYEYFKYSDPERTLSTGLTVFPSLTDWGRWRADYSMDFDIEFKRDFSWVISLFASYDSDPIAEDASSSDYGFRSSLAYTW